ncbi:ATP synthase alpha chain precursor [Purpureocillium lavendulum]|uniref:ATP synthase alpha chain n=1 Tax=Purpureocillium lavendulum TaxID=1247861 RepID=A0AB34G6K5_9HYPO|nr:ATP synthase alpha chain precursor [Purpureocillium lavendulum]
MPAVSYVHALAAGGPFPPGSKLASCTPPLRLASAPSHNDDDNDDHRHHDDMTGGRNAMARASLDGRSRKATLTNMVGKDDWPKLQLLQSTQPTNLREASPPKTNPWRRTNKPVSPVSNDTTVGTPDLASWPTPDHSRDFHPGKSQPPTPDSEVAEHYPQGSPATTTSGSKDKAPPSIPRDLKESTAPLNGHSTHDGQAEDDNGPVRDGYPGISPMALERSWKSWLWRTGAGADVVLHLDDKTYYCHREILTAGSGYFRDSLPEPTSVLRWKSPWWIMEDSTLTASNFSILAVELEVAQFKYDKAHDIAHVPMCVLLYLQAMGLRSPSMASHIIRLLEETAKQWGDIFESRLEYCLMTDNQANTFGTHLVNALDTTYSLADSAALMPLRLAMAGFLDAVFPVVARQHQEVGLFSAREWQLHAARITTDMYRSRQQRLSSDHMYNNQESMTALWEQCGQQGGLQNFLPLRMIRLPPLEDII